MTELKLLKSTRKRLALPKCWTKGAFSREFIGGNHGSMHGRATCWCITGSLLMDIPTPDTNDAYTWSCRAICKAAGISYPGERGDRRPGPQTAVQAWQDKEERTHKEVLEVLDKAILALEGRA